MKKLLLISALMFCMNSFAQKSDIKVDSLSILNPLNGHKIENITKTETLERKLDSLNAIYKTNKFTVVSYLSNGQATQCTIEKKLKDIEKEIF